MQKYEMADSETDLRQILWEEQHMNQEIKIAVCDELAEDREKYHPAAFGIHRQK